MTPSIGDIISWDTIASRNNYYGIITKFINNDEVIEISWFDEEAYENVGERISTWSYGTFWRVVENVPRN